MIELPERFYVTGTDTDVGKTVVSALLCKALERPYFKPVQSGEPADADTVRALAGVPVHPEAYRLAQASSPHTSADAEGVRIDLATIRAPAGPLLVEGAGGWKVPYGMHGGTVLWQADVVRHLQLPVVVVARSGLGTLNHTTLTVQAIRADDVPIVGLILVGEAHHDNERDLPLLNDVPLLARVDRGDLPHDFDRLAVRLAADLRRQP
ncbi:MAG: dethiobiotin synthase [Myxococcales bacterium]|nr:dethiobiotin synthase [Myxococcales bacterium]